MLLGVHNVRGGGGGAETEKIQVAFFPEIEND